MRFRVSSTIRFTGVLPGAHPPRRRIDPFSELNWHISILILFLGVLSGGGRFRKKPTSSNEVASPPPPAARAAPPYPGIPPTRRFIEYGLSQLGDAGAAGAEPEVMTPGASNRG
jgi:hypothetical protein